jgi:putative ABC transport system permease protein
MAEGGRHPQGAGWYRAPIDGWIFLVAGCLVAAIAMLTISFQAIKTALANPAKTLRSE